MIWNYLSTSLVWNDATIPYDVKLSKYIVWYENDVTKPYDMKWFKWIRECKTQIFKLQSLFRSFHTPFRAFKTQIFKLHVLTTKKEF